MQTHTLFVVSVVVSLEDIKTIKVERWLPNRKQVNLAPLVRQLCLSGGGTTGLERAASAVTGQPRYVNE
jgi:hypothetical protein